MSEYTFETAALKAVTIDAVKYNEEGLKNSLTPEAIKAVVPMDWGTYNVTFGKGATVATEGVGIGVNAKAGWDSTAIGFGTNANGGYSVAISGRGAYAKSDYSVIVGSIFWERVDGSDVYRSCTTEGAGSITIGPGANSRNTIADDGTITESSNSITIGCKASNQGADSVVIGAQAETEFAGNVVIGTKASGNKGTGNVSIGTKAKANHLAAAVGYDSNASYASLSNGYKSYSNTQGTAVGFTAEAGTSATAVGAVAKAKSVCSTAIGYVANSIKDNSITIGSQFVETVNGETVTNTCTTEGTGSITIGAGANTLNTTKTVDGVDTVVESSNAVTIGCKASNQGADSVVLGAQAKATAGATVAIGAGATSLFTSSVSLGSNSKTEGWCSTAVGTNAYGANGGTAIGLRAKAYMGLAVGGESVVNKYNAMALGGSAKATAFSSSAIGDSTTASADYATAIGRNATAADYGATVIRSTAEDGTYTQLYFSGANTPLAKKYFPTAWEQKQDVDPETGDPLFDGDGNPVMVDDPEKPIAGEAMMGYVAKDSAGNIIARGANMLSALFPYYTGEDDNPFQPTGMSLRGGEKPEPVAFHPSDLDMATEEPVNEPEEYQPLPVYPIVEPEMKEPEMSEYEPLPVYPIVEPEIEEIDE